MIGEQPYEVVAEDAEFYLSAETYLMQEKVNGRRCLVSTVAGIEAFNKQGRPALIALPAAIAEALPSGIVVDGEIVGGVFVVWDLLIVHGADLRNLAYGERLARLRQILVAGPSMRIVATWTGEIGKRRGFNNLQERRAEGAIFKRLDAPFTAGRSRNQVKVKFLKTFRC